MRWFRFWIHTSDDQMCEIDLHAESVASAMKLLDQLYAYDETHTLTFVEIQ
jgi:hypothetical protein